MAVSEPSPDRIQLIAGANLPSDHPRHRSSAGKRCLDLHSADRRVQRRSRPASEDGGQLLDKRAFRFAPVVLWTDQWIACSSGFTPFLAP